jgi:hypothetical protein
VYVYVNVLDRLIALILAWIAKLVILMLMLKLKLKLKLKSKDEQEMTVKLS